MRILGIDPGLQRTGFACLASSDRTPSSPCRVIDAGVIALDPKRSVAERLVELERDLRALLGTCAPERAGIEQLYAHYAHPTTAIVMGHARGVILLTLERAGVPIIELPSTEVKKAVTGNGHASKGQVAGAVRALLGLSETPEPADVTDAMAIALTAARRSFTPTSA